MCHDGSSNFCEATQLVVGGGGQGVKPDCLPLSPHPEPGRLVFENVNKRFFPCEPHSRVTSPPAPEFPFVLASSQPGRARNPRSIWSLCLLYSRDKGSRERSDPPAPTANIALGDRCGFRPTWRTPPGLQTAEPSPRVCTSPGLSPTVTRK